MRKDDEISSTEKLLDIIRQGKEKAAVSSNNSAAAVNDIPQASTKRVFSFSKNITAGLVFSRKRLFDSTGIEEKSVNSDSFELSLLHKLRSSRMLFVVSNKLGSSSAHKTRISVSAGELTLMLFDSDTLFFALLCTSY